MGNAFRAGYDHRRTRNAWTIPMAVVIAVLAFPIATSWFDGQFSGFGPGGPAIIFPLFLAVFSGCCCYVLTSLCAKCTADAETPLSDEY